MHLNNSVDYAKNPEKTALENSIAYAQNPSKITLQSEIGKALNAAASEKALFQTGINVDLNHAYAQMMNTKARWPRKRKRYGYHLVQSFSPGEITPEICHEIGVKFAQRCFGEKYECVVTTHLDRAHLHNHIVFNSTSFVDGWQYRDSFKDYYGDIRGFSDSFCREYGLSVIKTPKSRARSYIEHMNEKAGRPSNRSILRADIDIAVKQALSMKHFLSIMRQRGYSIRQTEKNITVQGAGMERGVRLTEKSLGAGYSQEDILARIHDKEVSLAHMLKRPVPVKRICRYRGRRPSPAIRYRGIVALYFRYLYLFGVIPAKYHSPRQKTAQLNRKELFRFERYKRQIAFLREHGFADAAELGQYAAAQEAEIQKLADARKQLHRLAEKEADPEKKAELRAAAKEYTQRMKPHRQDLRLCAQIKENTACFEQRLREQRNINEIYKSKTKELKNEYHRL